MKRDLNKKEYGDMARRLIAAREALGFENMTDYAREAKVPYKSYSQCENGTHPISIRNAIRLRERYGISLDFIYCGSVDTLAHKIASAVSSNPLLKTSKTSNDTGDS